jgi:hypothetical protein
MRKFAVVAIIAATVATLLFANSNNGDNRSACNPFEDVANGSVYTACQANIIKK